MNDLYFDGAFQPEIRPSTLSGGEKFTVMTDCTDNLHAYPWFHQLEPSGEYVCHEL